MKILYISKLEGHDWQGPTHSVPMQVAHQAQIDEVLWVNLAVSQKREWKALSYYREMEKGLKTGLDDMPEVFSKPDLIVFEGIYEYPFAALIRDVRKCGIPYVLVPRSALTESAQRKKTFKKLLGNALFFSSFIRSAAAVQYLTPDEWAESAKWNVPSFVVPNGMLAKEKTKHGFFCEDMLVLTYIGRIERYQKGLDLLIEACAGMAEELRRSNVSIRLYGPDREGSRSELLAEISKNALEDVLTLHDGVFGEEKERILLESDAFLMTSRFEGLPMGMIEALAYGLPVLATKGTNLTDEIAAADAGWTAENTAESIAEMLHAAICEKENYQKKAANALALSRKFNWESIAGDTHAEYEKLVAMR